MIGGFGLMEKKCDLCNRDITLNTNLSGLVFDDKYFLCEECHGTHSHEELDTWVKTIMKDPKTGMPGPRRRSPCRTGPRWCPGPP